MATATNKGKTGIWSDPVLLHDLVMCFYSATTEAGVMTAEIRKDVEARMKNLNHQVTWEGIRTIIIDRTHNNALLHDMRRKKKSIGSFLRAVFQHVKSTPESTGSNLV
ncbi:hypothetical protein E4U42_005349 [Claviceps africana]|uniref:Uncharacterized protein n=1 Tax=Claviceps africana TaxID=83212 RepID=A0A8K0NHH8_9HYPO|nr:hypothetical protein E4U42_005349 [Claviceps africana]